MVKTNHVYSDYDINCVRKCSNEARLARKDLRIYIGYDYNMTWSFAKHLGPYRASQIKINLVEKHEKNFQHIYVN